jgi:hypothetical protein
MKVNHSWSLSSKPQTQRLVLTLHQQFILIVVFGSIVIFLTTHAISSRTSFHALARTTEQKQQPYPKLRLPTPVIVVGFPKSGTTSIHHFFTCAKAHAQHFCCCGDTNDHAPCQVDTMAVCILKNMAQNRKMLHNCGEYQVYAQIDGERPILQPAGAAGSSDFKGVLLENGTLELHNIRQKVERQLLFRHFLPQHFSLEQLHADYPNATYILPLRDARDWANSAFSWFQMRGRTINEYMYFNQSLPRPGKANAKEFLARIYDEHSNMVRNFVRQHPSHAFIEFNITDPDAGRKLAETFGLEERCWGHHNQLGSRANDLLKKKTS